MEREDPKSDQGSESSDEYDDFGNRLRPKTPSRESLSALIEEDSAVSSVIEVAELHENKEYYPPAESVFPEAKVLIQEEDNEDIDQPIISRPSKQTYWVPAEIDGDFAGKFRAGLAGTTSDHRSICVVGESGSGKTTLCDWLLSSDEQLPFSRPLSRQMDDWVAEIDRQSTLRACPASLLLRDRGGKTLLAQFIDSPGVADFDAEVRSLASCCDVVLFVIDVCSGLGAQSTRLLKHLSAKGVPVLVVLNKIDRFVFEAKLTPEDAYLRLRGIADEARAAIGTEPILFFASGKYELFFGLEDLAERVFGAEGAKSRFRFLWGDVYYSPEGGFSPSPTSGSNRRTFVEFGLWPVYKVLARAVAAGGGDVEARLKAACGEWTCVAGLVDAVRRVAPKMRSLSTNETESVGGVLLALKNGPDPAEREAPVRKLAVLAKLLRGSLRVGDEVVNSDGVSRKVEFSLPVVSGTIEPMDEAGEGCIVWLHGFSATPGSLISVKGSEHSQANGMRSQEEQPLFTATGLPSPKSVPDLGVPGVLNVGVEPRTPEEMSALIESIQLACLCNRGLSYQTEETGELRLIGPGEIFLDFALYQIREVFGSLVVRVSEPTAEICETVSSLSSNFGLDPRSGLRVLCAPLEPQLISLWPEFTSIASDPESASTFLKSQCGWDTLSSRSLLSWGPPNRPAVLINDCLGPRRPSIASIKATLQSGFDWTAGAGPLTSAPLRGVVIRVVAASAAAPSRLVAAGLRRAAHAAMLLASPRLMEPVYLADILSRPEAMARVKELLSKRRGHILKEKPERGTPFMRLEAVVPVMDSLGFCDDVVGMSLGLASASLLFEGWQTVPGDPLDEEAVTKVLEPAETNKLARDVLVKTRRRKGLTDDIPLTQYFEDEQVINAMKGSL